MAGEDAQRIAAEILTGLPRDPEATKHREELAEALSRRKPKPPKKPPPNRPRRTGAVQA